MTSLRSPEMKLQYDQYRKEHAADTSCALCGREGLRSFTYWKIMENLFPYDRIAKTHHMIMPIRHVTEPELNQDELRELLEIKEQVLHQEYEWIMEATHLTKSIPDHFHLHLIVTK